MTISTKLVGAFLLLCVLAVTTTGTTVAQPRAAIMTEVAGAVTVTRASGSTADATWGMQLGEGDLVETGSNGSAAVLFPDGNLVSLGGSAQLTVATSSGEGRSVPVDRMADVSELQLHRAGQGEIAALGGLRSGGRAEVILPVSPRNSRVREATPTLSWHAADEFDEYQVAVYDPSGEIWSTTTTDSEIRYPADAPALEPGVEYLWKVTGVQMLDEVESEMVSFEILDADGRETLSADEERITAEFAGDADASSRDYLLGSLYARVGLLDDAARAFSDIARRHPDSPVVHEILGKLYYEMGLKDEAIESLKTALDHER